jgi:hypothetical protein
MISCKYISFFARFCKFQKLFYKTRLSKMHAKTPICFNLFNFHPVSNKFPMNIEHVILKNRMFFVFRIATFLAGKRRHKLGAKKLTVIYW